MFGNCDQKMLVISSNTNQWPQKNNFVADDKTFNNIIMASTSSGVAALPAAGRRVLGFNMEKIAQQQPQPQPQPQPQSQPPLQLKCPRCDSSNTKFCYYNNYSLSQPRHFCKSCKRYWTRGGTLRNVPVGGGYRKNKRVKRPLPPTAVAASSSSSFDGSSNSTTTSTAGATTIPNSHQISHFSSTAASNGYMNPLFYGLQDVGYGNFPVISDRSTNSKASNGFDSAFGNIAGLSSLGLGFPPLNSHTNGLINKQFNDPLFSSLSSSPTPSMAALLASTALHHQKPINGGEIQRSTEILGQNHLQTLITLQDLQVGVNNEAAIAMNKEGNKLGHQISGGQDGLSSNPSMYNSSWNNAGGIGAWLDPTSSNIGSSLTSFI